MAKRQKFYTKGRSSYIGIRLYILTYMKRPYSHWVSMVPNHHKVFEPGEHHKAFAKKRPKERFREVLCAMSKRVALASSIDEARLAMRIFGGGKPLGRSLESNVFFFLLEQPMYKQLIQNFQRCFFSAEIPDFDASLHEFWFVFWRLLGQQKVTFFFFLLLISLVYIVLHFTNHHFFFRI